MRRLSFLAALCLVFMLAFAPAAFAQGEDVTVEMEDNFFAPANVTVEPGTTVTWVQSGDNPHTTTSYDGLWDSGMIAGGSGESFSFTFEEPGTYDYFCIPHEQLGMVGTVTVTGGDDAEQDDDAEQVPDTGGPSLLVPLAAALLACGVAGLAFLNRRIS